MINCWWFIGVRSLNEKKTKLKEENKFCQVRRKKIVRNEEQTVTVADTDTDTDTLVLQELCEKKCDLDFEAVCSVCLTSGLEP